jgi:hypothetical protein
MNDELKGLLPVRRVPGACIILSTRPRSLSLDHSTLEGRGTRTVDCDSNTYLYYEVIGGYIDVRCVKVVLART